MKEISIGKTSLRIAEHKGDINYLNYVKFKQYVPQFWEKMDAPLFEAYFERVQDFYNEGKFMQAFGVLMDFKLARDQMKTNYDAWGVCFALIAYEKGEDTQRVLNDVDIQERLKRWELTPDKMVECVLDFMKASPETFRDHIALYEIRNMMTVTEY